MSEAFDPLLAWFATLTPLTLSGIDQVYAEDASFSDPFHQLQGRADIARLYQNMFTALGSARFEILDRVCEGPRAFVTWNFHYTLGNRPHILHGGSWLVLDEAGRILEHRDYWDAAAGVYEKLPLLGTLLRFVRRRWLTHG